ncbi:DUF6882 domain-containing protein [Comamonas sp. GB3 AK4-5]|uniref:DUF6882 domain-containing protein n=1 Tax=Comamonas sp. GB3 AK4-5 TaxID=3231487 RepID=UPI00351EDBE3
MSDSTERFIHVAREGLDLQTTAHAASWHLGEEKNWSADLEAGTIAFDFADGTVATAAIQVVGTYNQADGSFLWGWDHPSVPAVLGAHAQLARDWGQLQGAAAFTERKLQCSEDDAWSFAAVANRLAEANGVYRGTAGNTLVFMTFGSVRLQKNTV